MSSELPTKSKRGRKPASASASAPSKTRVSVKPVRPEGASAIAATNRREIPQTSFDFTAGLFQRTVVARRLAFILLTGAAALVVFSGYQVLTAQAQLTALSAGSDALAQRENAVVASLGTDTGGVDPRLIIDRDIALADSLSKVAESQADIRAVLAELGKYQVPGVSILDLRIGISAMGKGSETVFLEKDAGIPVKIVAQSQNILSAVTWADQLRRSPAFSGLSPLAGPAAGVVLVGYVKSDTLAKPMLDKLASLGVVYVAPASAIPAVPAVPASSSPASAGPSATATGAP